jgi:hypothetical protein
MKLGARGAALGRDRERGTVRAGGRGAHHAGDHALDADRPARPPPGPACAGRVPVRGRGPRRCLARRPSAPARARRGRVGPVDPARGPVARLRGRPCLPDRRPPRGRSPPPARPARRRHPEGRGGARRAPAHPVLRPGRRDGDGAAVARIRLRGARPPARHRRGCAAADLGAGAGGAGRLGQPRLSGAGRPGPRRRGPCPRLRPALARGAAPCPPPSNPPTDPSCDGARRWPCPAGRSRCGST